MSPQVVEQLSPQPFRQWSAWRIDPFGWDREDSPVVEDSAVRQLAFDLGIGDRKLHRWRNENQSLERIEVEEALHHADVGLWEVYPNPEKVSVPAPQHQPGYGSKLTDKQVADLHRFHAAGFPVKALAERIWEAAGYSSWQSAEWGIRAGFRRLGLPIRKGLRYAPAERRCTDLAKSGEPCRQFALKGSDRCFHHDRKRRIARLRGLDWDAREIGAIVGVDRSTVEGQLQRAVSA